MKRTLRGFTLIEMVMVIVVSGILMMIALPRLTRQSTKLAVGSSKQEIAAYLAEARAAAIQNGRAASFIRHGNTITVSIDTGSKITPYTATIDLYAKHGVTVSAAKDTVRFNARGIAAGLGGTLAIIVTKANIRDSVCVIGLGRISSRGCQL